ncbi:protocatechuate 3,4-dioxygenase subunit alpha [Nocardia sp. SYP-A9097]|uniref:protocatechuate 3,4-dioxygenase subunit alpha n=1 Tax=Nocardia sp. SYP-A9097 TaxID=2663237 RepID=UPI00129B6D81|nr:protocatechuate 3,4-dioxygenase subunit alpha [Nocardia sp. SYP-A9097]MRH93475.1 protocatechuate 3,4-dioxygenase subunit alpha [Nocardia sp. SYP-A9097]
MTETLLPSTPSQTVGPYLHIGLAWADGAFAVPEGTPGAVWIRGRVFDGDGNACPDAMIETWQADPQGRFDHPDAPGPVAPGWRGFGRSDTTTGEFAIHTVVPGAIPDSGGAPQAPHIDVSVFARGLLHRLVTRIYFPEFEGANGADPVLNSVAPQRRNSLIARPAVDGYTFDIALRGEHETVFFDV